MKRLLRKLARPIVDRGVPMADLKNFQQAMNEDSGAVAELASTTYWRYTRGYFPSQFLWFLRHPKILMALAQDAAGWSPEDIADLERRIEENAKQAKERRAEKPASKRISKK